MVSLGYSPQFMFILTYKITLLDGGLQTFSSNMVVTFFELYYWVYSIQNRDLIKQKLDFLLSTVLCLYSGLYQVQVAKEIYLATLVRMY